MPKPKAKIVSVAGVEVFQDSKPRLYMGCTIERLFPSGMYRALTSKGTVRADTVEGIKEMIRDIEKPTRKKK